jgi:hypothetical protein
VKVVVVVAVVLAVAGCRREGPDWRVKQFYAGKTSIDLLTSPAKVEAFRVEPVPRRAAPGEASAGPFVAAGPVTEVPPAEAAEISKLLLDAESYAWRRGAKREPFRAQAGLWFTRGAYSLHVALDVASGQIAAYAGGQLLGVQAIDPAREPLLAALRRVFPADAELQSLR